MIPYTKINVLLICVWLVSGRSKKLGQSLWLNSVAIILMFDGVLKLRFPKVRWQVIQDTEPGRADLLAHYLPLIMLPRPSNPRPVHLLIPYAANFAWGAAIDWDLEQAYGSSMTPEVSRKLWPWMGMAHIMAGVMARAAPPGTGRELRRLITHRK